MNRRQIGNTDLRVNEIGYGSMNLTTFRETRLPEDEAVRFLERAVDEFGVEFIDTADAYCLDDSETHYGERVIARALKGERRQHVVVSTKGGFIRPNGAWKPDGRPEHLRATCEESLRALETDRIDLYQFHRPDPAVPIGESLGALADLQREGKIRHIGVSNFSQAQLESAMRIVEIASIQNPLSFIHFTPDRGEMLKFCEANRITWIAYAPVGGHRNAHRLPEFDEWMQQSIRSTDASCYSIALAWLLHISPSIIPIPATTRIEHLAANMQAAEIRLTDEEVAELYQPKSWMSYYFEAKQKGEYDEAVRQLQKGLVFDANDDMTWYNLSCVYALRGEVDRAFDALDRSIALGFRDAGHTREDSDFEAIRTDPRFDEALERMEGMVRS
jgi:aryl-alcohol dehydrogenase-like predicted oxidoreductase